MLSRHARAYKNSQQLCLCSQELHNVGPEEIAVPNPTPNAELLVTDSYWGIESPGSILTQVLAARRGLKQAKENIKPVRKGGDGI